MEQEEPSLDALLEKSLAKSGATSPQDALIVVLHSSLLSSGFVCVYVGDEGFGEGVKLPEVSSASKPELPPEWNVSQDVCALQYRHVATEQTCLIKAIPMGETLLISAVVATQMDRVISTTLTPSKFVKDCPSYSTPKIYKNLLELVSVLQSEVVVKLIQLCEESIGAAGGKVCFGVQAGSTSGPGPGPGPSPLAPDDPLRIVPPRGPDPLDISDPLRIGPPRRPGRGPPIHGDPDPLGEMNPFGYGDRDRFPGGGGSGMIFDPLRQGSRGGVPGFGGPAGSYPPGHPPGARYDPVGPLRPTFRPQPPRGGRPPPSGFHGPDPDHLPPPGYDDMFS